ncbi:hypothetical protein D910_01504 [Dendroctonus ponderosae]|uniref:Reverse transcriptase domain-containing protein n=1 Tax=Dendroctonus ponderosae TaxID=77166 RepID=U4U0M9_DENPD|nr:hypothetical protein D910_01504 [Dendroctonus ponderosae]
MIKPKTWQFLEIDWGNISILSSEDTYCPCKWRLPDKYETIKCTKCFGKVHLACHGYISIEAVDKTKFSCYTCVYSRTNQNKLNNMNMLMKMRLSRILFNLLMDKIIEEVSFLNSEYRMNNRAISMVFYADDAAIFAESEDDLQSQLFKFHRKTKTMTIAKEPMRCKLSTKRRTGCGKMGKAEEKRMAQPREEDDRRKTTTHCTRGKISRDPSIWKTTKAMERQLAVHISGNNRAILYGIRLEKSIPCEIQLATKNEAAYILEQLDSLGVFDWSSSSFIKINDKSLSSAILATFNFEDSRYLK